jgi:hypothetical protein
MSIMVQVAVEADPDLTEERAERVVRGLRAELSRLDVDSVTFADGGPPPAGAKSADVVSLGAIMIAMSASGGVFTSLIQSVRDWLGRQTGRHKVSITIDDDTIELEQATAAQQQALVDAYIDRHSGG